MKHAIAASFMLFFSFSVCAYEPTEDEISQHRAEVYALASDYIKSTFNLEVIDESQFFPVRFDSKGLWGDFEARIEDLGSDWFEVHGWLSASGIDEIEVAWSVVIKYKLENPEAWRYQRLDVEHSANSPTFTSWSFGRYESVPYIADIARLTGKSVSDGS